MTSYRVYFQGMPKPIKLGFIRTSDIELRELLKAWLAISVAFAIVMAGFHFNRIFLAVMVLSAFTVGVGFLLHELAHKIVAQAYGAWAEFRAFNQMLVLAILMSFFGFVFAAPGAVFIHGHLTTRKNGIISAAGPWTNLVLGLLFYIGNMFFNFWGVFFEYGFFINAWLALFNMIPLWNFDGKKIWMWSKTAYIVTLILSAALMFSWYV